MNIRRHYIVALLLQIGCILTTIAFTVFMQEGLIEKTFVNVCRYGTIICILSFLCIWMMQKNLITCLNLFFLAFCLFQFGLPIMYAIKENYHSFYIGLFDEKILFPAALYSVYGIQIFAVGLEFGIWCRQYQRKSYFNNVNRIKLSEVLDKNKKLVSHAALIMFLATGIIVVPVCLKAALMALLAGGGGIGYRGMLTANGLLRFVQEFFFPSGLLYLIYSEKKYYKIMVVGIYGFASLLMLIVADRAGGLTALFILVFYIFFYRDTKKMLEKIKANIRFICIGAVLLFMLVYVAEARTGNTSIFRIFQRGIFSSVISEMGFNFTTICFIMDYIPSMTGFRYGITYWSSIPLLLPKSFDFLNLYDYFSSQLGEMWLYRTNHELRGEQLDFGVGFSMIGESYYNFAWLGLIALLLIAILVAVLLADSKDKNNSWAKYVQLALLMKYIMIPRRQFLDMLKPIEYSVFFMLVYLLVYIQIGKKLAGQGGQNGDSK